VVESFRVAIQAEQRALWVGVEEGPGVAAETDGGINEKARGRRPET